MDEDSPYLGKPDSPWRDACGVVGVFAPGEDVSRLAYFGLFTLQHRGQESAGIAVADGQSIRCEKGMGLVQGVFDEERLGRLQGGHLAIGHTRYSTTGSTTLSNAQPVVVNFRGQQIAVGHNGNLVNALPLRQKLSGLGHTFQGTSDTELIALRLAASQEKKIEDALAEAMNDFTGAYSLVILTPEKLLGVRDPYGVRPLCIGRFERGGWVLASETCALRPLNSHFVREVEPGEIVIIDRNGLQDLQTPAAERKACCIFEFIYFARPDSDIYGKRLYTVRRRMGHVLAREHPARADLVIPIPESAKPHAMGYAEASKTPLGDGLVKNHYIFRTFIQPEQWQRDLGARIKYNPVPEEIRGKRVVVVDDSIVRGTTTRQIVQLLRDAGAREVHLRVSSPPIRYPCFYGIDMANQDQFIAYHRTEAEVGQHVGADSIGYLSLDGLIEAIGLPRGAFCTACLSNRYPIPVPKDVKVTKMSLENAPNGEES